jgi:MFS family permease
MPLLMNNKIILPRPVVIQFTPGSHPVRNHSLIATLLTLRGNPRGCVYTEVLWGIPFNLFAPYASVYMLALGLSDQQIGSIVSISMAIQIGMMLFSGVVTDKLGRRRTTLIADLLSWSIPALIWAVAQNFWFFLVAALFNTFWRIAWNSWTCLLVEDADQKQLVDIYTWIYIANQIVGFIAPLAGLMIAAYGLVDTMRGLYFFAALMFTLKAFITYRMTTETQQGRVRMQETKGQSPWSVLREYKGVLGTVLRSPPTLYLAALMLANQITWTINGSFWSIIVTQKLHVPEQYLALFPFLKSSIILFFFFAINPLLNRLHFKVPLVVGYLGYLASQLLLVTAPSLGYAFLIPSVFLEACSFAVVSPLSDKLMVLNIEAKERARIQSIVFMVVILLTSPFGWIAGSLSEVDKALPFVLNLALYGVAAGLAWRIGSLSQRAPLPAST